MIFPPKSKITSCPLQAELKSGTSHSSTAVRRRYKASAMASRSVRELRECGSSTILDAIIF